MTITKNTVGIFAVALAIFAMLAIPFAFAPQAHASDYGYDYYDTFTPDYGGGGYDYYDTFTPDYGGSYDYYDTFTPDYGGSYDYYDTFTPDSGYGGYGGSSFGSYGGGMGGWSMPFSTMGRGAPSMSQSQSQSSTNVNTNTNACTAGSCNTNINAPTNIVTTNPAPQTTVVYAQNPSYPVYPNYPTVPQYDICPNIAGVQPTLPAGYYIQNGNCFWYTTGSQQPYVTLSAVPYTGYEMGPLGTALYWSFLVLWCLVAAYLIAVKKVQNKIASYFFGGSTAAPVAHATHAHAVHAPKGTVAPAPAQFDGIDPFIASQIARSSK